MASSLPARNQLTFTSHCNVQLVQLVQLNNNICSCSIIVLFTSLLLFLSQIPSSIISGQTTIVIMIYFCEKLSTKFSRVIWLCTIIQIHQWQTRASHGNLGTLRFQGSIVLLWGAGGDCSQTAISELQIPDCSHSPHPTDPTTF